ncbi:type II toxin-antitoxin system death-on-curing family toxin [Cypionkella sinensis]|uniref:Type II toxin-antitoxin system death-on-curing family toxin n=1 Tax=Cypionkella sinensis TaxID=1756043 RepID=A0ABV7J829_9RHOB
MAHDEALVFGGRDGISSLHLIESALARPYSGYHRPITRKAAAVLHSMVSNHGFLDGNKRTAWLLVEILVDRSGYVLDIPDDERIDDFGLPLLMGNMIFSKFPIGLLRASADHRHPLPKRPLFL